MNERRFTIGDLVRRSHLGCEEYVDARDFDALTKENANLKKRLAITERAFKICLNERRNCEIIGREIEVQA